MVDILKLIDIIKSKGGNVESTPNYLNLIGIRDLTKVNSFNDTLIWFWLNHDGSIEVRSTKKGFTTDPGLKSLTNPVNCKGCAILKEGWHKNIWTKGKHKNKYAALVQVNPCEVYRDNNKDGNFNLDPTTIDKGLFGINLHKANEKATSVLVDGWSAGCQVVADYVEFTVLMQAVDNALKAGQKYFSYMLLNKSEIE